MSAMVVATAGVAHAAVALPHSAPDDTAMLAGTSVRAIAQSGNLLWLGGNFTQILDHNGALIQSAADLAAFNATTGAFATGVHIPMVTKASSPATVYDLSLGPDGNLYLAGNFDHVDGFQRNGVAAIDPTTGQLLSFAANAGSSNTVLATASAIYVGGQRLSSFQPNGTPTPGFTPPKVFIDGTLRGHLTPPQFRDLQIVGNTLVAACQCDSLTDANGTRNVKALVQIDATTGDWVNWVPAGMVNAPFGISVIVHDFPGTTTPTVYLAAGGSDFTAAFDFASGSVRWKTDTSGSSQGITWYQGSLVIGGHFDWTPKTVGQQCGDNASPNTACYLSPHLVMMDPSTGKIVIDPATGNPWNPGIRCLYNGVWTVFTGNDGTTLNVGGEFTKVGAVGWTYTPNPATYTPGPGGVKQQFYARFSGAPAGTQPLNVNTSGPGGVTSDVGGIDCGTVCSANIPQGTVVTLTATPVAGNLFAGWSGDCTGTGTCQVTMSQARNVTATFTVVSRTLTVTKAGTGTGKVTSAPAGINCGTTCTAAFTDGTQVVLTEIPTSPNLFVGWSGPDAGTCGLATTCSLTMSAARSVTATFAKPKSLTLTFAGAGTGHVTSAPAGVDCTATCTVNLPMGGTYVLTATADPGDSFTAWSGADGAACGTAPTCQVTMSVARTVTATFALGGPVLTVSTNGTGAGSVTSAPAGISCPGTCASGFASGTDVTLTATPGAGATFTGWSGDCTGAGTCDVTMDQARGVTATFAGPAGSCGAIAFASSRSGAGDIYSMNPDGSGLLQLTSGAATDASPAWSSDCASVAFVSGQDIDVMNANGTGLAQLTASAGVNTDPTWSLDGTKIAFASTRSGGNRNIYVMNADGTGVTQLTTDAAPAEAYQPMWSPDGTKIAFVSTRTGSAQVFVMSTAGSGQVKLTQGLGASTSPGWSPDGSHIAFIARSSGTNQVWSMSATGTGAVRVVSDAKTDTHPSWSPDGTQIVYSSNATTGGQNQLFVVNANGTGVQQITNTTTSETQPAWSN